MASAAHLNTLLFSAATSTSPNLRRITTVRCGPRNNRGPLMKGRILSIEAIQAIQSLKRAHRSDPDNLPTHILSRLIKSDLEAALKELLRQDQCAVAARVFSALRSEHGADLEAYAEMVVALARNGLAEEIDRLIFEMEVEGGIRCGESKGLLRLVQALIGAGRKESTVRMYGMMKRSECEMDDYLGKVLSKGLRGFGEDGLADEVGLELGRLYKETRPSLRFCRAFQNNRFVESVLDSYWELPPVAACRSLTRQAGKGRVERLGPPVVERKLGLAFITRGIVEKLIHDNLTLDDLEKSGGALSSSSTSSKARVKI
ncbi:Unknown protein [Striga hermonthica]|uniref:Uncharacterized protein n=1 Tax=Striga hermonthica TaxID=68872 RepID=A0A9N7NQ29_STRHE|nr:Unknown protein [Striga hermonthica]